MRWSASTTQAYFVLLPNIAVGFSTALCRYFARHRELEFFVVWFNEEHFSQLSGIVELWFLDSPSLFCFLFRCIRHMLPHIWPYIVWSCHTLSGLEVVCFLVSLSLGPCVSVSDVYVVLLTSMYFIGVGNDSSFGMCSLTLGST